MSEQWLPVVGHEHYSVSSHGRVRSPSGRIMRAASRSAYPKVNLYLEGVPTCRYVHALVAEAFLGPRPEGMEVNHIDGCKTNPRLENLEYVAHSENGKHAHDTGLVRPAVSARNARCRLTDTQVRRIRRLALAPAKVLQSLAREMGVSDRHVFHIATGERRQALPYLPGEHRRPKGPPRRLQVA